MINDRSTKNELETMQAQDRGLLGTIKDMQLEITRLKSLTSEPAITTTTPVTITNFIRNSDFIFNQSGYEAATFTGADDYIAHAYKRASSVTTSLTQHTITVVSTDGITVDTVTPSLSTYWKKDEGQIAWGADDALYFPLKSPVASPGYPIWIKIISKLADGVAIAGKKLRITIWDNAVPGIATGVPPKLIATRQGASGTVTRKYILRVTTNSGTFFSNVTPSALNGGYIENTVSVTNIDTANFVDVLWDDFAEATRYELFRWDSADPAGADRWYKIADINSSGHTFSDKGTRPTALVLTSAPAQTNLQAVIVISDFGDRIALNPTEFKEADIQLIMPSTYQLSTDQWLRFDILNSDDSLANLDDGAVLVDKIALSYTKGQWTPSPDDSGKIPVSLNPTPGGIRHTSCVTLDGLVDVYDMDHKIVKKPVGEIVYLQHVVSPDPVTGEIGESIVTEITDKYTDELRIFVTDNKVLTCSRTQPIISYFKDTDGKAAALFNTGDTILMFDENFADIAYWARTSVKDRKLKEKVKVRIFSLIGVSGNKSNHTLVVNGHIIHNVKPFNDNGE